MAGRSRGMILSFAYWSLRRLLELVVLRCRSEREKEIEILLLRLWRAKIRSHQICREIALPRIVARYASTTPCDRTNRTVAPRPRDRRML